MWYVGHFGYVGILDMWVCGTFWICGIGHVCLCTCIGGALAN